MPDNRFVSLAVQLQHFITPQGKEKSNNKSETRTLSASCSDNIHMLYHKKIVTDPKQISDAYHSTVYKATSNVSFIFCISTELFNP